MRLGSLPELKGVGSLLPLNRTTHPLQKLLALDPEESPPNFNSLDGDELTLE